MSGALVLHFWSTADREREREREKETKTEVQNYERQRRIEFLPGRRARDGTVSQPSAIIDHDHQRTESIASLPVT